MKLRKRRSGLERPRCHRVNGKGRECGFILKTDVVLFGDAVQHFDTLFEVLNESDLLLVIGTSLLHLACLPFQKRYLSISLLIFHFLQLKEAVTRRNKINLLLFHNIKNAVVDILSDVQVFATIPIRRSGPKTWTSDRMSTTAFLIL